MAAVDSLALPGSPEYIATTQDITHRTEATLGRFERELGTFGLGTEIEISGDPVELVDVFRTVRDSEHGQTLGRWSRWRHVQGELTPEEHHQLLGPDAKILDHSLNNALGWVELAGIQKTGPGGERNGLNTISDELFPVGVMAEFTHDTPEATLEDWPSFSKNATRSMVEQLIHGDVLEELFGVDMPLFVKIIRVLDKRDLGGISDEDLQEAEGQYRDITGNNPGSKATVIRDAIRSRTPLESQGAEVHSLVEQKSYFRTAENAWRAVKASRERGGYRDIEGDKYEDFYAALAVSVLTSDIDRLTASANKFTHFRMMLWESRVFIDEVFEEDPEIMTTMLHSSDKVLGNPDQTKAAVDQQLQRFEEAKRTWRNFGWPRHADEFRLR